MGEHFSVELPSFDEQWTHIAITRQNGTLRIFQDGVKILQETASASIVSELTAVHVGIDPDYVSTTYYLGKLSNLHFVKGYALYDSDFTPPTSAIRPCAGSVGLFLARTSGSMYGNSIVDYAEVELIDSGSTPITWTNDTPFNG